MHPNQRLILIQKWYDAHHIQLINHPSLQVLPKEIIEQFAWIWSLISPKHCKTSKLQELSNAQHGKVFL